MQASLIWRTAIRGLGDKTNKPGIADDAVAGSIISIKFRDVAYFIGIIAEKTTPPDNLATILYKDLDGMFDMQVNVNLNNAIFQLGGTIGREELETFVEGHGEQSGTLYRNCPHCDEDLSGKYGDDESLMDEHEANCKSKIDSLPRHEKGNTCKRNDNEADKLDGKAPKRRKTGQTNKSTISDEEHSKDESAEESVGPKSSQPAPNGTTRHTVEDDNTLQISNATGKEGTGDNTLQRTRKRSTASKQQAGIAGRRTSSRIATQTNEITNSDVDIRRGNTVTPMNVDGVEAGANAMAEGQPTMNDVQTNANGEAGENDVPYDGGANRSTMAGLKQSLEEDSDDDDDTVTEFRRQQQERDRAAADEDGVLNGGSIDEELSMVRQRVANESKSILQNVVNEASTQLLSETGGLQKQAIGKATSQLEKATIDMKATHVMKLDAEEQKIKASMLGTGCITRKALEKACRDVDSAKKKISNEYDRQLNEERQHLGKKITAEIMPSSRFTFGEMLTVGLVSGIVGYMLHK